MEESLVTKEEAKDLREKYLGESLVKALTAPTPTEDDDFGPWIETRPARGGMKVKYVPGFRFIQRLNECFGFLWSYSVKEHFIKDNQIVTLGQLKVQIPGKTIIRELPNGITETIKIDGLEVIKEQFGSSEIKKYKDSSKGMLDLGDDMKGAATDAMKKCATEFGLFLDIYGPRGSVEEGIAKEQLDTLYWRGEKAGMSREETDKWATEKLGKPAKDSDPFDVMGLIPALVDIAKAREK